MTAVCHCCVSSAAMCHCLKQSHQRRPQHTCRRDGLDVRSKGLPATIKEGINLLNVIQDVYLDKSITVA